MKRIAMSINNASNGLQKVRKVPVEDLRIVGKPFECFSTVCRGTHGLFTSLLAAETWAVKFDGTRPWLLLWHVIISRMLPKFPLPHGALSHVAAVFRIYVEESLQRSWGTWEPVSKSGSRIVWVRLRHTPPRYSETLWLQNRQHQKRFVVMYFCAWNGWGSRGIIGAEGRPVVRGDVQEYSNNLGLAQYSWHIRFRYNVTTRNADSVVWIAKT